MFSETELEKKQKFINYTKRFVEQNPNTFDIVEIAKLFISVQSILNGDLNEINSKSFDDLSKYVRTSQVFKKFEQKIINKEKEIKLNSIDNELNKLTEQLTELKSYISKNLGSYYSNDAISLIEKSEKEINELNSLDNLKSTHEEIKNLFNLINTYEENLNIVNSLLPDLKSYLAKHMSSEIGPGIIEKIEILEKTINEKNPDNLNRIIKETNEFIETKIIKYEKQVLEEKRKEEEKLAEEKRKEEEKLAEEKRKKEEKLAEEKRIKEEKLAEEKRKKEEERLQSTFKKYNAKTQFQKDFVRSLLSIPNIELRSVKFSSGDKLIAIDGNFSSLNANYPNDFIDFKNLKLKNLNKNVFYKIVKSIENLEFDTSVFKEKKWFDEISLEKISGTIEKNQFASGIIFKKLEFKDFLKNVSIIDKSAVKFGLKQNHIDLIAAAFSFSIDKLITDKFYLLLDSQKREFGYEKAEGSDISLLDWGTWYVKNSFDIDYNLNTEVTYEYSEVKNVTFDKNEIIKIAQKINPKNIDNMDYKIFINILDSLGSGKTLNVLVKDPITKKQILSLDSVNINSIKFNYIDNNKQQKFLTEFGFDLEGLDINVNEVSPEFSTYFTLLGYNSVKFDFGSNYSLEQNNDLNFDLDMGITDATSINFESTFSGLDLNQITNFTDDALLAYLSTNIKVKKIGLSLVDNSLRDKLFALAAQTSNSSTSRFKSDLIKQMDAYLVNSQQTRLFKQYRQAVIKFINGSKKISIKVEPPKPISFMEMVPYFINPDVNIIIDKLNLNIKN